MRRSSLDKLREDLRLQQVYNTLLRYGYDTVLERTAYFGGFRHAMQTWVWRLPPGWEEPGAAVKVRLMLEELGPTYVKIGQIVSSQASVLPVDMATELAKLQDAVPPFPSDQVRERIIEELGAPPEELYATFDPVPLAAASIGQVHRATLRDGDDVVVKVQRPGIRSVPIEVDLEILFHPGPRFVSRSTPRGRPMGQRPLRIVEEFKPRDRARNSTTSSRQSTLSGSPRLYVRHRRVRVYVPKVYREATTARGC